MASWFKGLLNSAENYYNNNRRYIIPFWRNTSRTYTGVAKRMRNRFGKENKKRTFRHFKSRFYNLGYKWLMRFANNNFNFKYDFCISALVRNGYSREVTLKVVNQVLYNEFNLMSVFYGENNNVQSQWQNLSKLYKYYRICAVKVRYKAYQTIDSQIMKPDSPISDQTTINVPKLYLKHIPNLMIQILTQHEHQAFPNPASGGDVQRQLDRPYSRIISADDDAKFYRTFPARPNYDSYLNQNDDCLFHVVPTTQNNAQIWFRMTLTDDFLSNLSYDWPLGTLHVTVYSTFKNSTI